MWKIVTRTVRESLERSSCRYNVFSQNVQDHSTDTTNNRRTHTSKDNSSTSSNKSRSKCIIAKFPTIYKCCAKPKYKGTRDKESNQKWDASFNNSQYNWSDAFRLSGIIAFGWSVGWIMCQSLNLQRKIFFERKKHDLDKWRRKLLTTPHLQPSKLLKNLLLPQTNFLLATCSASSNPTPADKFDNEFIQETSHQEKAYGPITVEEALKEAIEEFSSIQEAAKGEVELSFGSAAIREERYEDAIEHFTSGASHSSIPSMFNLALCYELGLGTSINYDKAAEFYQKAAELGHADAMYNLGIFHAQGKGGLKTNLNAARQWFKQAADQGHRQAKLALELEKSTKPTAYEAKANYNTSVTTLGGNPLNNMVNKLSHYEKLLTNKDKEQDTSMELFEETSMNPTDTFLELLGVCDKRVVNSGQTGL